MKHLLARLLPRPALVAAALLASATLASAQYSTPIRDVDEPARNRHKLEYHCAGVTCSTVQTVPTGYVFVIESILFQLASGAMPELILAPVATTQSLYLPPTYTVAASNFNYGVYSLRLYSDGLPAINIASSVMANSGSWINLHGYLVKK